MRSAGGGRDLLALFVCWRAIAGAGRSTDPRRADSGEPVRPLVYPSAAAPRSGKTGRCTAYDADQGMSPADRRDHSRRGDRERAHGYLGTALDHGHGHRGGQGDRDRGDRAHLPALAAQPAALAASARERRRQYLAVAIVLSPQNLLVCLGQRGEVTADVG